MRLTVATVLNATGARVARVTPEGDVEPSPLLVADLEKELPGVSIDSRTARPDDLFVALPGERVDGNDFAADALAAGARACLLSRLPAGRPLPGAPGGDPARYLFEVPDTATALQALATFWRSRHRAIVVGVTGSIGKTTTKEILAQLLAPAGPVLKSEANLNTEIGLPLTLLRLRPEHATAVLEMGMYEKGDIALLARVARPQVGVVTAVAPIHLARMGTIEAIAREKSELVAALPPDGLAVLNGDDPWTRAMGRVSGTAPAVLVGLSEDCQYRAVEVVSRGMDGTSFTVLAEGQELPIRTRVPGVHTVHAFLAGIAVARHLEVGWNELKRAAETARLETRQRVLRSPDGLLIIDDSYNAAPMSMRAALDLLQTCPGPRIAVLGDMLELGSGEEEAHREVGANAAAAVDWLVARGPRAAWIADEALKRGMSRDRVVVTQDNQGAVEAVREIASRAPMAVGARPAPGGKETEGNRWAVLVKGSRGMRMEEIVEGLRGEGCTAET